MNEEIKISKKDSVACNYWKACDYYKQLKRLEKENEELKVYNEKLYNQSSKINANLVKARFCNDKYRHALEEIKEIAQFACDKSICHKDCKMCSDGKIIDKINKVLGSEEK